MMNRFVLRQQPFSDPISRNDVEIFQQKWEDAANTFFLVSILLSNSDLLTWQASSPLKIRYFVRWFQVKVNSEAAQNLISFHCCLKIQKHVQRYQYLFFICLVQSILWMTQVWYICWHPDEAKTSGDYTIDIFFPYVRFHFMRYKILMASGMCTWKKVWNLRQE